MLFTFFKGGQPEVDEFADCLVSDEMLASISIPVADEIENGDTPSKIFFTFKNV